MSSRLLGSLLTIALLALLPAGRTLAQGGPLQIVVPLPAATPTGELARLMSLQLARRLGRPVVVDYRPGGNSRVAQDHVRAAKPDGNTLLWSTSAIVVEPALAGQPQEVARDLQPLALSARASLVMVARPGLAQRSFQELLAALRQGARLSCGYGGGAMLLACSALKQLNPDGVVLVGYASSGLALPDVAGERLDVAFTLLEPTVKSLAAAGKLNLMGRTHSGSTDPALASLPRLDRLMPQLDISPWQAWFAPAGTPPEATRRFLQAAREAMLEPEMAQRLDDFDFQAEFVPEPAFSRLLAAEYQRYAALLTPPR